ADPPHDARRGIRIRRQPREPKLGLVRHQTEASYAGATRAGTRHGAGASRGPGPTRSITHPSGAAGQAPWRLGTMPTFNNHRLRQAPTLLPTQRASGTIGPPQPPAPHRRQTGTIHTARDPSRFMKNLIET